MTCSHNADIGTAERRIVGSATVVNLILLQFLSGFAWAVQRPQGFVVILFERAGFSGPAIGLISAVGLVAPIFTGPLIGVLPVCCLAGSSLSSSALVLWVGIGIDVHAGSMLPWWPVNGDHFALCWDGNLRQSKAVGRGRVCHGILADWTSCAVAECIHRL